MIRGTARIDLLEIIGYETHPSALVRLVTGLLCVVGASAIGVGGRGGSIVAAICQLYLAAHWGHQAIVISIERYRTLGPGNVPGVRNTFFFLLALACVLLILYMFHKRSLRYFGWRDRHHHEQIASPAH